MRIVHVVDAAQAQAQVQARFSPPPTTSPPRRVQAVNSQAGPDDPSGVSTSPPDDGISLALSPESREAARKAMMEELRESLAKRSSADTGEAQELTPEAQAQRAHEEQAIQDLQTRDSQVRARERVRAAAIGTNGSPATFTYQAGPDGRLYAIGGEVKIDTSEVVGDPEATLRKAQQIAHAAFVPGDPSAEDRRAATMAAAMAARARQELARQKEENDQERAAPAVHHVSQNG